VLGILAVTTESRHGTLTPSLLIVPNRVRLILAKLAAHLGAGLALGAVTFAACAALALAILHARGIHTHLHGGDIAAYVAGGTAASALFAALGVGLGAIMRNQVGAIAGALAYLFAIEPLIAIAPSLHAAVQKYGVIGVANGLTGTSSDPATVLDRLPAGLLLTAYAATSVIFGMTIMRRRDISA
jgi:ABC-2 type transport system permease protein